MKVELNISFLCGPKQFCNALRTNIAIIYIHHSIKKKYIYISILFNILIPQMLKNSVSIFQLE